MLIHIGLVLWAVWFACWLAWPRSAPPGQWEGWSGRWSHWLLLVSGFICIFRTVAFKPFYPVALSPASYAVGFVFVIAGLSLTCWSRWHLGKYWSHLVGIMEDHELIQTGPYSVVRHPLYTGLLLAFMGTSILASTPIAIMGLCLVTASMLIKLRHEEMLLSCNFPVKYNLLCSAVPRRLIPFLY